MYRALFSPKSQVIGAYPDAIEVVTSKDTQVSYSPAITAVLFVVGLGVGYAIGGVALALSGGIFGFGIADMLGVGLSKTVPLSLKIAD